MTTIAVSRPEDALTHERAADFLASILRPESPRSLREEHPAIFGPCRIGELRICWENSRPLGGAALAVRRWTTPRGPLQLGLIGSVATDPELRGRGIARNVLTACERELADRGCPVAMLWADDAAFYAHLGYTAAGTEYVAVVDRALPSDAGGACREFTEADLDYVELLRLREPSRSNRSRNESLTAFRGSGTRVLVHTDANGEIDGYLAVGRGQDLPGVAHEAAGPFPVLSSLLECARAGRPNPTEPLYALVNPCRADWLAGLRALGLEVHAGVLGMAKVLNAAALRAGLAAAYPARAIPLLTQWTDVDLLHAVLGYRGTRGPLDELEKRLGIGATSLFPLTPFVSGFESI